MPTTEVIFFQNDDKRSEVYDFLKELEATNPRAYAKCVVRIERLERLGCDLRRPEADYLRDDIFELRARFSSVNYRLLYFFHGRQVAVLACGLTKEDIIPNQLIDEAIARKAAFAKDPSRHTFKAPED